MKVTIPIGRFTCQAYIGDEKTLLDFNLDRSNITDLAGFTICRTHGVLSTFVAWIDCYMHNILNVNRKIE